MFLPECPTEDPCYYEVAPLIMCGIGYSIYASVIWGSIPYTVEPRTVGTAYGICTAIQNIGLAYAPWQVISIIGSDYNYKGADIFFIGVNIVGLISGIVLYIVDIKYYNGILDKVDKGDELEALITSPNPG